MPVRRGAISISQSMATAFLVLACVLFMSYAAEVLKPLALAVLLSFSLAPISRLIQRTGVPRTPASALTVVLVLALLGAVVYQVGQQFTAISSRLPVYEQNLLAKLRRVQPTGTGIVEKTSKVVNDVTQSLSRPHPEHGSTEVSDGESNEKPVAVRIVSRRSIQELIGELFGPTVEFLGSAVFILILVFFLLVNREDLSQRIINLVGTQRVSLTTKTMDEVDQRISRYLVTFAGVNSAIGLVVGLGLRLIGVEYAALWGVLAALLRFIPYVGPGLAFVLALAFSIASAPGADLRQPLMVVGLFALIELVANSYLEPVIYGKTTGVSSFGLLVAAVFWTWLWGPIGLLLSTPLTVCLTVIGRYVPGLRAFATLLAEETTLTPALQFCQRLIAMDQDGATELIEKQLESRPRAEVFDQVLIPALSQTERDVAKGDVDEREQAFVWRVIGDALDELAETPECDLQTLAARGDVTTDPVVALDVAIVAIAANDHADALALRMLEILLKPFGYELKVITNVGTTLELVDRVADAHPSLVVVSHVPPNGLANVRSLTRRIHARTEGLLTIVGCWGRSTDEEGVAQRLKAAGASAVVFKLQDARERIVSLFRPQSHDALAPSRPAPVADEA